MSRRRVVFVARRFWPLVGEAENALAELVAALPDAGIEPTVVTPLWQNNWPQTFHFEGVRVVRMARPTSSWWGDGGYTRRLTKWLSQTHEGIDTVAVDARDPSVEAVMAIARRCGISVVVFSDEDHGSDQRRRVSKLFSPQQGLAHAVVIPSERTADSWLRAGYSATQVHVIAPGIRTCDKAVTQARRAARQSLGKAFCNAQLSTLTPLAIYQHALDNSPPMEALLRAWKAIATRRPDARLWIFGSGRGRAATYDLIESLNLRDRVLLPGEMESIDELLAAADIYVSLDCGTTPTYLLTAMAYCKAIVASDTGNHRQFITNNEHGLIADAHDESELAAALERIRAQPTLANALGENARQRTHREFSLQDRVDNFARLIRALHGRIRNP